jgi:hypothetical protein
MRLFAITVLIVCCLIASPASGQQQGTAKVFVYSNLSIGLGYPFAFRGSASALFDRRHEVSAGYTFFERKATGIPTGYENYGLLDNSNHYPQEDFRGIELTYGYVVYPHRFADRIRYVLRAGVFIGQQSTPYNYYPVSQTGFISFGPNYGHATRERTAAAFVIHPTFDYTPRRAFGTSLGLYGILSEDYSGGGVSVGILLGKVGNRKRQRKS